MTASRVIEAASTGGNIAGNSVESISQYDIFQPGIGIYGNGLFDVRENSIISIMGGTFGVDCSAATGSTVRVHDNMIDGFTTGLNNCTDAGENDISP